MTVLNKDKILEAAKDFIAQGKLDKAIKEYEKLLSADPKDMRVKLRVAELFAKQRQVSEAIQAYRFVAESYTRDGFFLKAVTVLKNILRLNPSLSDVNESLAALYEKMGLHKDASYQYEILASAFEQKDKREEALKMRQKLVELFPEEPTYRTRLAESLQREDRKDEAIEQFEILAKQYRKEKKDPKKLVDLYERILPSRPENNEMLTDLVTLYCEMKNYKAALKWLEQKKQAVSLDPYLLSLQAGMYGDLNQLDTARGKYQQLAGLYMERGEILKALEAYEEILVLLPEEAATVRQEVDKIQAGAFEGILKNAGEKRKQKEKEEEQKRLDEEVKKLDQGPKTTDHGQRTMDYGLKKEEKRKLGEKDIASLLKKAKASLGLAQAYQSTGLLDEAKQELNHAKGALEKILSLEPNHSEARALLQKLPKI